MTLIAAFRTGGYSDAGVVVCADSQETVGDYRVDVKKIRPRDAGQYELIIGGAGNTAALIDGQADAIERNVRQWPSGLSDDEARQRVERVLLAYHARQVALYPAEPHEKQLRFILCLRDKSSSQIYLWKTDGTTIEVVGNYVLLGWEEAVYDYEVKWLYYPGIWITQAVLLGVHLFTVAKNSLYVGDPTQVIVVRDNGMHVEDVKDIKILEDRIAEFNRALAQLVLACPDLSIQEGEFKGVLANFGEQVEMLRYHYLQGGISRSLIQALSDPNFAGDSYPKLPLGTLKRVGRAATKYKTTDEDNWAASVSVSSSASPSPSPSASPGDDDLEESEDL